MNTFAKIDAPRRDLGRVIPVLAPADVAVPRISHRRALIGAWSVDPVSNRPICSWSEHWSGGRHKNFTPLSV